MEQQKDANVVVSSDDTRRRIEDEARSSLLEGETDVALPNRFQFKAKSSSSATCLKRDLTKRLCHVRYVSMTLTDKQVFSRMKAVVTKLKNKRTAELAFQHH